MHEQAGTGALRGALGMLAILMMMLQTTTSAQNATGSGGTGTWQLRVCAAKDDLPYSDRNQEGFTNQIMSTLARGLHAELDYVWLPKLQNADQNLLLLNEGKCDVFLDAGDASDAFLLTLAYYQTTYYFVQRSDAPVKISSLDDANLARMRVGVVAASPPDVSLGVRGMSDELVHYYPSSGNPAQQMVAAVADQELDLAVVFGPLAGYFAAQQSVPLSLTPVAPQVELSGLSMVYPTSMGVRKGDTDLRDLLNRALANHWDEVQQVLKDNHVPTLALPRPVISVGG